MASLQEFLEVLADAYPDEKVKLGSWVSYRRRDFKKGKLSPERSAVLEALPGWEWNS